MLIDKDIMKKIKKMFYYDYEAVEKEDGFLVPADRLAQLVEELVVEIREREIEFEEYKEYVADNYREIPYSQQVCVNDDMFH